MNMKWFYNLKMSIKLLAGFILVAFIAGSIGILGIADIISMKNANAQLYKNVTIPISQISAISTEFQKMRVAISDMVYSQRQWKVEEDIKIIKESRIEIEDYIQGLDNKIISIEMRGVYDRFIDYNKAFNAQVDTLMELAGTNNYEALVKNSQSTVFEDITYEVQETINKMVLLIVADASKTEKENAKLADVTMLVLGILIFVAMAISVLLGFFISKIISGAMKNAAEMMQEMSKGHFSMRLNMDSEDEIGQMSQAMDSFAEDMQNIFIASINKISEGDTDINVEAKDEDDEIGPVLSNTIHTIRSLTDEVGTLIKDAQEGKLSARGNPEVYSGNWRELVIGINELIDAFVEPINITTEYMERISRGDIPEKITDTYLGDYNLIKESLNTCIDAINAVAEDANTLVENALEGNLDIRADAKRHGGEFKEIIDGFNNTLDAIIMPLKESINVLNEMAQGNLRMRVEGEYKGDHARIKDALNDTLDSLSSYVSEIAGTLTEMANSNMVVQISGDYKGDFVEIKEALNLIINSFNEVLSEISKASDQVASGSEQVACGSQALSQGATEQASAIEQLSASIGDISVEVKKNATNASNASKISSDSAEKVEHGNEQMGKMLNAIIEIKESSDKISRIIKTIDDIAFQTNILALNAAVEAARAGASGKGFAVVADEVRNLALKSADAAKETAELIEGSIKAVEVGTRMADKVAKSLNSIVESTKEATGLINQISDVSNEQAISINQITQGVDQISYVVQTNSATAEESAAASEELSSQAKVLKSLVSKFKLKTHDNSYEHRDILQVMEI